MTYGKTRKTPFVFSPKYTTIYYSQCDQIGTPSVCGGPNSFSPQLPNSATLEIRNFCDGFCVQSKAELTKTEELRSSGSTGRFFTNTSLYYPNSLTLQLLNSLTPEIRNFCGGFCVRSWGVAELGSSDLHILTLWRASILVTMIIPNIISWTSYYYLLFCIDAKNR